MTPAELQRLRGLAERATPGPFAVHRYDRDGGGFSYQVQSEYHTPDGLDAMSGCVLCAHDEDDAPRAKVDAELHAAMRNSLPALLAEVERLQRENAALGATVLADAGSYMRGYKVACDGYNVGCDKANAVGYARAVADVVAWLRLHRGLRDVVAARIEQGAHVGAGEKA